MKSDGISANLVNETALTFKNLKAKPTEQNQLGVQIGSLLKDKNTYCLPPLIVKVTCMNVKFVSFTRKVNEENSIRTCIFQAINLFYEDY